VEEAEEAEEAPVEEAEEAPVEEPVTTAAGKKRFEIRRTK
jgi:hypothetical protein